MIRATRLTAALLAVVLLAGCAARTVRISELKNRPGKYDDKTIAVNGTVTSSWSVPLIPYQFYNVDDGSGEISVLSRAGRAPSKGAQVKVKGRLNDIASFGGRSVGLHIEERDRDID
jgi:hypothetical protein